jgi:hypothetical protein
MFKPAVKDVCLPTKFKLQVDESLQNAPLANGITALETVNTLSEEAALDMSCLS